MASRRRHPRQALNPGCPRTVFKPAGSLKKNTEKEVCCKNSCLIHEKGPIPKDVGVNAVSQCNIMQPSATGELCRPSSLQGDDVSHIGANI